MVSEGELFDFLRQRFGIGDWDEYVDERPYWKWRNIEISKIKGMCRKRRVAVDDLYLAAQYAAERGETITGIWSLLQYIGPARKARRATWTNPRQNLRQRLVEAATAAQEAGETEWATRLFAADPGAAEELLAAWEAHRG